MQGDSDMPLNAAIDHAYNARRAGAFWATAPSNNVTLENVEAKLQALGSRRASVVLEGTETYMVEFAKGARRALES